MGDFEKTVRYLVKVVGICVLIYVVVNGLIFFFE